MLCGLWFLRLSDWHGLAKELIDSVNVIVFKVDLFLLASDARYRGLGLLHDLLWEGVLDKDMGHLVLAAVQIPVGARRHAPRLSLLIC